jgi:PhnB protein
MSPFLPSLNRFRVGKILSEPRSLGRRISENHKHKSMTTTNKTAAIQPYLFFDGRCEEAIEFYRGSIGAEVTMLLRFKDSPEQSVADKDSPDMAEKIQHATLLVGSTTFFASDGHRQGKPNFEGFSLSLTVTTDAEAEQAFNALAEGGQVQLPLTKTFFSSSFGMLTDRFGVGWMVMVGS